MKRTFRATTLGGITLLALTGCFQQTNTATSGTITVVDASPIMALKSIPKYNGILTMGQYKKPGGKRQIRNYPNSR